MATIQQHPAQTAPPIGNGPDTKPKDSNSNAAPRKARTKRPNYNEIHARPLPLEIHPLPAFIPHNPLSIVRIAITLLSQSIWRPSSHPAAHKAYFSVETQSIHVTDPKTIRALWEQGFWGSGSLSRSEPQWLAQEKRKRGIDAITTSEEVTRKRREERRQFKLERAKAQREAIEQQLREEGKLDAETNLDELVENGNVTESPKGTLYPSDAGVPLGDVSATHVNTVMEEVEKTLAEEMPSFDTAIKDEEHLQLTFEEAFFLSYVLGVLDVYHHDIRLDSSELFRLICAHSEYLSDGDEFSSRIPNSLMACPIEPDNSFILKYVVFHHFRSLGWVVRAGIKFACDYLLYLRGPAFTHAEFAIMIVPAYSDPYWSATSERAAACKNKEQRDWWWLHRLNRVQTQVHKTLLLVYVEIPPPWDKYETKSAGVDVGNVLQRYRVREFVWRRWSPNRNRD
ncbi:tRNA splicing endonuclease subunit sen2 [Kalmusia sp. IMI 367209]|nr:tRNA splicing endonuclease subunit sen2 [Kalmusia sp. IMI 367209]